MRHGAGLRPHGEQLSSEWAGPGPSQVQVERQRLGRCGPGQRESELWGEGSSPFYCTHC